MPQGPRYYVYSDLTVHNSAEDALSGASPGSTLKDNYNSVEGSGTPYIDNFSGYESYYPAVPIWWVPSSGGSGYNIGWIDDRKNGFPLTVGDAGGVSKRAKGAWVGDAGGVPRKAKAVYVGDAAGVPRKAK